ncbi:MAG: hypothetical protein JSR86_13745 [Proteobacteria bacterium]|nr:hypothetical protein [Pseudomonadota bacterium]
MRIGTGLMLSPALAALLSLAVAACEQHKAPAVSSAPSIQHDALSGKASSQAWLASCYAAGGRCIGITPDPAMACAWSAVRLLSRSPDLSLADSEAYEAACNLPRESERQRAAIAAADFGDRIYGQGADARLAAGKALAETPVLYPSVEAVRTRINLALAHARRAERLPIFAAAPPAKAGDSAVAWSSCADPICLQADTPAFGGGVIRYRVTVRIAGTGEAAAATLAGRLAAEGLEASSLGELLGDGQQHEFGQGPACWRAGKDAAGIMYAGAARGPCQGR